MVTEEANRQLEHEKVAEAEAEAPSSEELKPLLFMYFNSVVHESLKMVGDHPILAGISGYHDRCDFLEKFTPEMYESINSTFIWPSRGLGGKMMKTECIIRHFDTVEGKGVEPSEGMQFRGVIDLGHDTDMDDGEEY